MSSLLQSTGSSPYVLVHIVGPLAATPDTNFWIWGDLGKAELTKWLSSSDHVLVNVFFRRCFVVFSAIAFLHRIELILLGDYWHFNKKQQTSARTPGHRSNRRVIESLSLDQWFLTFTNTPNPYVVFQAFVEPHFCPITESKNGLHVSDDLRRTSETAPSNHRGSVEPRLRTTALDF